MFFDQFKAFDEQSQIKCIIRKYFYPQWCATCSELPSNISTLVSAEKEKDKMEDADSVSFELIVEGIII